MRALTPIAISITMAFALAACDRLDDTENQPTPEPAAAPAVDATAQPAPGNGNAADMAASPGDPAAATADDALALGLLSSVNKHEIAAAKQAESKKVSAPVMEYAKMMDTQHSENETKTEALGTLANTDEVQAKKAKGEQELAELDKKSGKDYETAYVAAMVKGHTEALALIDARLIPLASSEPVKQHLAETREHVAMHLEAAKKLQSDAK